MKKNEERNWENTNPPRITFSTTRKRVILVRGEPERSKEKRFLLELLHLAQGYKGYEGKMWSLIWRDTNEFLRGSWEGACYKQDEATGRDWAMHSPAGAHKTSTQRKHSPWQVRTSPRVEMFAHSLSLRAKTLRRILCWGHDATPSSNWSQTCLWTLKLWDSNETRTFCKSAFKWSLGEVRAETKLEESQSYSNIMNIRWGFNRTIGCLVISRDARISPYTLYKHYTSNNCFVKGLTINIDMIWSK